MLGSAAVAWPLAARAQQMPVVGFLNTQSPAVAAHHAAGFRKGLNQTGYVEGRNVAIEFLWSEGQYDRLPELAADLVRRHVAVIVAAYFPAVLAARAAAASRIPIVFISGVDPVAAGLGASLNRPGGNRPGPTKFHTTLAAKRLELMHQVAPNASTIAMLVNPTTPATKATEAEAKTATETLGLRLKLVYASTADEIDAAFASLVTDKVGALVVTGDAFFASRFEQIVALAARDRVPVLYDRREDVVAGGLMSYGTNLIDLYRQAGVYAGKILNGARPADLPVEQATKIELVVNLKTAKSLGIDMPMSILLRADEVIE